MLSTGTTDGNDVRLQTVSIARLMGGSFNVAMSQVQFPVVNVAGNVRKWGPFDGTNGFYYQLSDSTLSTCVIKDSTVTKVDNGSFNGQLGTYYNLTTSPRGYEIYYGGVKAYYTVAGTLLHTATATSSPLTSTRHLPMRFENNNGAGITTNVAMNIPIATIYRLGKEKTSPKYLYIIGNNNTTVCKSSPGTLHRIMINDGAAGSSISIYDNATGAGTIIGIFATDSLAVITTIPFDVPFYNGLTIIVNNTVNFTVIYE